METGNQSDRFLLSSATAKKRTQTKERARKESNKDAAANTA
jgi:hypothetical protein